jgi:hypothetical protein
MRVALCKLVIVLWAVLGLAQLSTAYAHEAASVSQPAASTLSTVAPAYLSNCPGLSEPDRPADVQVYCSGVFLAGETVAIRLPATAKSRQQPPADSDIAAVAPTPDLPPPRF